MAVTYVNSGAATGSGVTTLAVSKPSGVADGDLILLFTICYGSTVSFPAGFTTIDDQVGAISSNHRSACAWKIASSEGASWTITYGTSTWPGIIAFVLRGTAQTSPIKNHSVKNDAASYVTTLPPPGTRTIADATDATVYWYSGINSAGSGSNTPTMPGGFTNSLTSTNASLGSANGVGWGINLGSQGSATAPSGVDYVDMFIDIAAAATGGPPKIMRQQQAVQRAAVW